MGQTVPKEEPAESAIEGMEVPEQRLPNIPKQQAPDIPTDEIPMKVQRYDFTQPVPEGAAVENSYFQDAAFVGDSRTDGFLIYSGIGCGENLTSNGLSIFQLAEKKVLKRQGVSYTLLEVLAQKQYGKVYLSLGINELGVYNDEGFYQAYCDAIDRIRESQPNAVIYIQGLIPLNEDVIRETGGKDYLRTDRLLVYNDLMKQVAMEKQVAFLDLNPVFTDETGQLPADASRDGVHLRGEYCKLWLEYLKTHTVEYEELYPNVEETENETNLEPDDGNSAGAGSDSLREEPLFL
jgi:hypothetical protein